MNKISIKGNVDQINNRVEPIASTIETIYDLMRSLNNAIEWHEQTEDGSDEAIKDIYGQETLDHLNNLRDQVIVAKYEIIKLRGLELDVIKNQSRGNY